MGLLSPNARGCYFWAFFAAYKPPLGKSTRTKVGVIKSASALKAPTPVSQYAEKAGLKAVPVGGGVPLAICFDDLLGQFIIASIERFFRDPLVLRYPGGWVGLEVETMGQIAMHLVVHSLVFLLPQHDPGLELTSPPSHDGIVQNLATLGVVERYAVVVAH